MPNNNDQQAGGPGGGAQPIGYNEGSREGQTTDGQTEQTSSGQIGTDNVEQDQHSSEGEPGRAQSETTGGQNQSETSDVANPAHSDSRV
jgi:hypothetical protein